MVDRSFAFVVAGASCVVVVVAASACALRRVERLAAAAPATTTQLAPAKDRSTKRTRSSARGAAAEDLPEPGRTKRRSAGIRPTRETETEEANGKEKVGQELGQGEQEIGEEIGEEDEEEEKEEESPQSPASWRTQGDDLSLIHI